MSLGKNIQKFVEKKISEMNLVKRDFMRLSNTNPNIFHKIMIGVYHNPKLVNISKIADFCHSSIDEVLGRNPKYYQSIPEQFIPTTQESIVKNMTSFVETKLKEHNISPYQLSRKIDASERTIDQFLNPNLNSTLGAKTATAVADYFDVSLDVMIGRVNPEIAMSLSKTIPENLKNLSKQDLDKLEAIKKSLDPNTLSPISNTSNFAHKNTTQNKGGRSF